MHIYQRLGITPVINGYECLTSLGGSLMRPEVLQAMTEASQHFVRLDQLQQVVGERIAELIGVEAAYVTSGAAAGLVLAAAACMAGTDRTRIVQLPDSHALRNHGRRVRVLSSLAIRVGQTAGNWRRRSHPTQQLWPILSPMRRRQRCLCAWWRRLPMPTICP
jgi:hypothetical protein